MKARSVLTALLLALALAGCAGQGNPHVQGSQAPRARCASSPGPGAPGAETGVFIYLLCIEGP